MAMKKPKVLYFFKGHYVPPQVRSEMAMIPADVQFRNALEIGDSDTTEQCDGVAGDIPAPYRNHPTAEQACRAWQTSLQDEHERLSLEADRDAQKRQKEIDARNAREGASGPPNSVLVKKTSKPEKAPSKAASDESDEPEGSEDSKPAWGKKGKG